MQPHPSTTSPVQLQHLAYQAKPKSVAAPVLVSAQKQDEQQAPFNCHLCGSQFCFKSGLNVLIQAICEVRKFK